MPLDLSAYQAVLLDLDGTLYHEEHALPGAVELVRRLSDRNQRFACLTNSTTSPLRIMERLDRMGIDVAPDQIYSAAAAACDYVMQHFPAAGEPRQPRVFNLATDGVAQMLANLVTFVENPGEPCDVVIAGAPANAFATEERRRIALYLLRGGAALVGICADRVYPSQRGLEFGSGALSLMLGYAANVRPIFCGKPEPIFFNELSQRLKLDLQRCVLIGDNLEADIAGAKALGIRTILTLTGVTRRRDLLQVSAELQPDAIVEDLRELL